MTLGGTVYRLDPDPASGGPPGPAAAVLTLAFAGPNPARPRTTLRMTSGTAGLVRLVLLDALGREVAVPYDGFLEAATPTEVPLDAADLAPGIYVARLQTAAAGTSLRVVVAR